MLRNAVGGGRVSDFPGKKRYKDIRFNIISVTRGGWVSNFQEKNMTLHLNGPLALELAFRSIEYKN